jgi:NAD(P)H-hydrate epimerase
MQLITPEYLRERLLRRKNDSHKHDFGRLLVVAGCETMPGAALLATGAALSSGCGLVMLHSTQRTLLAAAAAYPSALLSEDPGDHFTTVPEQLHRYEAIAIGPGLGWSPGTLNAFMDLMLEACAKRIPMVLDADALNILSVLSDWAELIPPGSVLTPHKGELKRLLPCKSDAEREILAWELCAEARCHIVMKGYHSRIFCPGGECLVNTTGNPGMAKGGSGDVLTGLIGGLLARGYPAVDAAAIGVWIHGHAGDVLTAERTMEAYSSQDLIGKLPCGFTALYNEKTLKP